MTFGQGAPRVRRLRRFDTRAAGRHPLTTGADDALPRARLRWIVSRAWGGHSKHARVARISYPLSRDITTFYRLTKLSTAIPPKRRYPETIPLNVGAGRAEKPNRMSTRSSKAIGSSSVYDPIRIPPMPQSHF